MATVVKELMKAIKEKCNNATMIPGWEALRWVTVRNSTHIWVSEKLEVGTSDGTAVYAYHTSTKTQTKRLCIFKGSDLSEDVPNTGLDAIEYVEPFRTIDATCLNDNERRYSLRIMMRACFILRGHSTDGLCGISTTFTEYFRRSLAVIMRPDTATNSADVSSTVRSGSTSPSGGLGGNEDGINVRYLSFTSLSRAEIAQVTRSDTDPTGEPLGRTNGAPALQQPFIGGTPSKLFSNPAFSIVPSFAATKMSTPRTSSESSQAEEDNNLPSDQDDAPRRGWRPINKYLANQTPTPSKGRIGMFVPGNSTTPSPSRPRMPGKTISQRPSNNTPKKRTYGMFDEVARENIESPKSARNSSQPSVVIPPKRRRVKLHEPNGNSDDVVVGGKAPATASKTTTTILHKAPKIIGDIVAHANRDHQVQMVEMFRGNGDNNTNRNRSTTANNDIETSSAYIVDTVESESDHESLFVGSRSKQQSTLKEGVSEAESDHESLFVGSRPKQQSTLKEGVSEAESDSDPELYEGISLDRKQTTKEYLRLKTSMETAKTRITLHQILIDDYDKEQVEKALKLDNSEKRLQIEHASITAKFEQEIKILRERMDAELQAIKEKVEKENSEMESRIQDCKNKQVAERTKMDDAIRDTDNAKRRLKEIEITGGFQLGMDVMTVVSRKPKSRV